MHTQTLGAQTVATSERMRRRLVIVLLLLVGGAIVNVAVAWGCGMCSKLSREDTVHVVTEPIPTRSPNRCRCAVNYPA